MSGSDDCGMCLVVHAMKWVHLPLGNLGSSKKTSERGVCLRDVNRTPTIIVNSLRIGERVFQRVDGT